MENSSWNNALIHELLTDPSGFKERGRAYQLLEQFFAGMPVETLRPLLRHGDPLVKHAAVWVASELGDTACVLLDDVSPLARSNERFLTYHALEVTAVCAIGSRADRYVNVLRALENDDDIIRVLAMRLLSRADVTQLQAAANSIGHISGNESLHRRGLLLLAGCEALNHEEVRCALHDECIVMAMYGAIAAKRIYNKYPKLLQAAAEVADASIRRFATGEMRSTESTGSE